jgi:enamine deaminase RidA (YjgF/YER057c/UK114 family)
MTKITRLNQNERLSRIVIHGETVYIAGITSAVNGDIKTQTRDVLRQIDDHLAAAGSDKHHLLTVQIWLKDISADFADMNSVWVEWVPKDALPTRATGEVKMASSNLLVEIIVSAAKLPS